MTFSTPFTCTEIIAHVMTLKYFALASKICVGAEDKRQNLLILWVKLGNCVSDWPECLIPGVHYGRSQHWFYFCMFHFLCITCRWEKSVDHINAATKLFFSLSISFGVITEFWPDLGLKLLPETTSNVTQIKPLENRSRADFFQNSFL